MKPSSEQLRRSAEIFRTPTIAPMKTIRLKPGKERSLQRQHPWVFDGAIARGGADAGETVRVDSAEGGFLAWGAYSPDSKIRVRAWSFDQAQRIDAAFFRDTLRRAIALRYLADGLTVPVDDIIITNGRVLTMDAGRLTGDGAFHAHVPAPA